jgi:hypothetical protein
MFENYREMSADEKARVKAINVVLRTKTPSREGNLAWAFVRGFKYRRVERTTRTQVMADGSVVNHNPPNLVAVARIIVTAMPELEAAYFKGTYALADSCPLIAWAKDPSGAIPAPVREKKAFVRPQVAVA